jgi:DNA polymerase III delta subunit
VAVGLGERTVVTEDDLAVIGRKAAEALRQDVVNRVSRKDVSGALRALDGALLFRGNTEIRLVAMLTHRMMNIATARNRREAGEGRPARIWPAEWKEVEPAVNRFDQEGLRRSLLALTDADRTLKSRPKNPRAVLEHTIITICT